MKSLSLILCGMQLYKRRKTQHGCVENYPHKPLELIMQSMLIKTVLCLKYRVRNTDTIKQSGNIFKDPPLRTKIISAL